MNRTKPRVELLANSDLYLVALAVRQCTDTTDRLDSTPENLGMDDKALIQTRILKSNGPLEPAHESVLEHLVYTFRVSDISRAVLQEVARHRIGASPSVKSTRYALQRIKKMSLTELSKQIVLTGYHEIDLDNFEQLQKVQQLKRDRVPNDVAKYALPEAFKTEMVWTINARSLRNFLVLRTSPAAHHEIRDMAWEIIDAIPYEHRFIFMDRIHERKSAS